MALEQHASAAGIAGRCRMAASRRNDKPRGRAVSRKRRSEAACGTH